MVGAKVEEVELLCSPNSVAFSAADNLLASDMVTVLLILRVSGTSNYWVIADLDILSRTDILQPYDQPSGV